MKNNEIDLKSSPGVWDEIYNKGQQLNRVPQGECFTFLLKELNSDIKNKKLLEIGCGVGNNIFFATKILGMRAVGIDHSAKAVEIANKNNVDRSLDADFKVMDASDLDFSNGAFECVIDRAALQHNTYDKCVRIIDEVYRVLKKGGLFYLTATSQDHHLYGRGISLGDGAYRDDEGEGVRQFFSNSQIMELVERRFKVLKWHVVDSHDMLSNTRVAKLHHLGCVKV